MNKKKNTVQKTQSKTTQKNTSLEQHEHSNKPRMGTDASYYESWNLLSQEFEDTKGVIRIRKSKDRQHNGQKKKDKRPNNDLQNITHKTKY
jgi:hypothetical protein